MLPGMHPLHIYQILNHYTSRQDLDPGFDVLDNSANQRPDWYQYWPIRRFLLTEFLNENAFYGFLSPKFHHKTNLSAALVRIAARLLERIDPGVKLDQLVSDSRNTVHANYFIAKPRFWRAWLAVNEQLFAIAESADDPLGRELRMPTSYQGQENVQMKIFIMERVATWILTRVRSFVAQERDPFAARARIYKLPVAIVCDALKIAYATEGRGQYKDVFLLVRNLRSVRPSLRALKSYWQSGEP